MIATLKVPSFLKFPRGGAEEELQRVTKRMSPLAGANIAPPLGVTHTVPNVLASVPWDSQWKFNGNGNDSVAVHHLTNNNSATFTTGKLGGATGATQLVHSSNQFWSIADPTALRLGSNDMSIALWTQLASKGAYVSCLLSKGQSSVGQVEYGIFYENSLDRFRFTTWASGAGDPQYVTANTFGAPSVNTWYFIVAQYVGETKTMKLSVNGGAFDSQARTSGTVASSATQLCVGNYAWNTGVGLSYDGLVDDVRMTISEQGGGAILTAEQVAALYNNGNGTEQ